MAEIVLPPLIQVLFEKLASPILQDFGFRINLKKEMDKLRSTLQFIQAVLKDAEERQVKDKAVRVWLAELKEVAYDADDLLDEFMAKALENKGSQVRKIASSFKKSMIVSNLKSIQEKLERITWQSSNFHLSERIADSRPETGGRRQTGSFVIESEVYGRLDDKEKIVELLLVRTNTSNTRDVSVIPIVGLGGIGKTTLARLVYNDERVNRHFNLKMWVCVTDNFNFGRLIKAIIESATMNKCDFSEMNLQQSHLQESLRGKKYLLVLDDVWNEDQDEWDEMKSLLKCGAEGSKIIVTTRSRKVASIMRSTHQYYMEGLSEDDCWALFRQQAFDQGEEEDHPNLLAIGKQIVKKCAGVPLAGKTLGGLMRFKREEREWLFVQESEFWNLCEGENAILPALRLSYNHLPSHLKPCFAYCSIFPKNYEIKKEELIHQWIAQGFILSSEGSKTQEDIGNEYLDDLLWRSFFQDAKKCNDGSVTECKMHDLIHDLARSVVGNEFIILEHDRAPSNLAQTRHGRAPRNLAQTRHLSVLGETLNNIGVLKIAKNLRTLRIGNPPFGKILLTEFSRQLFSSFRYLCMLDLKGWDIETLHASIGELKCLRYLDLSNTCIETLPETICGLHNFQTLNLLDCNKLVKLPSKMGNMISLRHLNIKGCETLICLPTRIGQLVQLQTLPIFIVEHEDRKSLMELHSLNLQGELNIKHLENVRNAKEAVVANLREKPKIQSLELSWGNDKEGLNAKSATEAIVTKLKEKKHVSSSGPPQGQDSGVQLGEDVEDLLEGLQPHPNLRRLSVKGYAGITFPSWMRAFELPNLIEVVLINCIRCECLPSLGQLLFLKVLYLHRMDAVTCIGNEFYGEGTGRAFPSLKELTLRDFPNLKFWWSVDGREVFPSLGKLIINKCSKLTTMPRFSSLQHLELRNCNAMILRSAASLTLLSILVIDVFPELLSLPEGLLQNNSLLTSLTIISCPKLRSLPGELGNLVALKSLTIRWCEEVASLPQELQNLTSLESLEISECQSLNFLPEEGIQGLHSLHSLSIENCNNLTYLPSALQQLKALEHLTIMYCPKLASLPEGMQHLSTLQSLNILSCPELASLPEGLQHVTTLRNLEIRSCPGLTALTESVENLISLRSLAISDCHNLTSLPEGLQCLKTLQHLSIRECPILEQRFKRLRYEDWIKIAHIPLIHIDNLGWPAQQAACQLEI